MFVLSLSLGLFGVLSAQREGRRNVAVLIDSCAASSHKLFIGQWLGLVFTMLNLLIALHILVTGVMLITGVHLDVIALFKSLFVICFPWALFSVTMGFVLGSFTPIFISVPAVGGIWYATSVLAFFGRLGEWLPAPWEALVDPSTISAASASVSFGFLPAGRILTNRIFYLGVSLLVLGIGALFYKRSRENRLNRGVISLASLGFATILVAITIGWGQFLTTNNQVFGSAPSYSNQVQVERYEINLDLLPDGKGMLVKVLMSVRNTGQQVIDSLVFALNGGLQIEKMAAGDGPESLEWQKLEGGLYQVQMAEPLDPGQVTSISVSYSGGILEWYSPGWQQQPEPLAFLKGRGIVLPSYVNWYPVLDQQGQFVEKHFSVQVKGHARPLVVNLPRIEANFWEGTTSDLFLASANWHDVKEGDFRLWYTPGQGKSA
ncbi:MAG: hypothetical protein GX335_07765, partial [Firmicutes bacterium]|nr:hypothetical protein [Bacillota bacterium]